MTGFQTPQAVTVIGAGMVGLSCAVQLQAQGIAVTVINNKSLEERTSFGHGGVIAACACVPVSTPGIVKQVPQWLLDPLGPLSLPIRHLPKLTGWGVGFVRNSRERAFQQTVSALAALLDDALKLHLEQARLIDALEVIQSAPYYYLYRDEAAFQRDSLAWQMRQQFGNVYELLADGDIQQLESAIASEFAFAVKLHDHGMTTSPSAVLQKLQDYFLSQGGEILTETVQRIGSNNQIHGVRLDTDQATHHCEKVVIAAGAWSGTLAKQLGDKVNLQAEGGYHVQVKNPNIQLNAPVMFSEGKLVATPMAGGDIRFAGLVEMGGLTAPMNEKFAERLLTHAKKLFPAIHTDEQVKWHGYRPSTADSLPVIGYSPNNADVVYAFGHQHIGFTLAPRTAQLVTQLLTGEPTDVDLTPYRIERFMGH